MRAEDEQYRIHNILTQVLLLRNQRIEPEHYALVVRRTLVGLLQLVLSASSCYSCIA
jgi:hypothetical protein